MNNKTNHFNLTEDIDLDDEFDPLADFEADEDDEVTGDYLGYAAEGNEAIEAATSAPIDEDLPAEERVATLLVQMAPRRKVLLGIMGFCREPQPVDAVNALVDELQENNFSVYSAANLCTLLEKAGGIERVTADGEAADSIELEPQVVEVDGVEYLEAAEPVEIFWVATDAGTAAVDADKPLERFMDLLAADERYLPVYKRLLTLCSAEGGATTADLGTAVDKHELMQSPRLYAPHFIDKLEKCDAIVWKKTWVATEIGHAGLAALENVADIEMTVEAEEA